jgi:catechol 2,3-dioxygenase-like lactoylglutathione lyase family enzyme
MRINLIRDGRTVRAELSNSGDLRSLSARAAWGVDRSDANDALAGMIIWDTEEHLWVDQRWLRHAANCDSGERSGQFDAMISCATRKGWVDPDSGNVRVHLEPSAVIGRLDNVGIACRQLSRTVDFFRTLGATVVADSESTPPGATVNLDGSYLYVFETASPGERLGARMPDLTKNPAGVDHISFTVEDVDSAYAELRRRGVHFVAEPSSNEEWGLRTAAFVDPDDNLYFLVTGIGP